MIALIVLILILSLFNASMLLLAIKILRGKG